MALFQTIGSNVNILSNADVQINKALSVGTYTVQEDPRTGVLYLHRIETEYISKKIYGTIENTIVDRIISTYTDRSGSLGVLLSGSKGCSKTLITQLVSQKLQQRNSLSTIIIHKSMDTYKIVELLNAIHDPCIVVFDEFEKNFGIQGEDEDEDENSLQDGLLSVLDGNMHADMLFLFVTNDIRKISPFFINRPGRIYYHFKMDRISEEVIQEYCDDHLDNKEYIKEIKLLANILRYFSFDMLEAIVYECNKYAVPPKEAIQYLNITLETHNERKKITIITPKNNKYQYIEWINPLAPYRTIYTRKSELISGKYVDNECTEIDLTPEQLVSVSDNNTYTYLKDGYTVIFSDSPLLNISEMFDKYTGI